MGWIKKGWDQTYGKAWNSITNHGDRNRNNPRMPDYQGPGAGYGEPRDEGFTWFSGAGERILRDHPLDEQGLPTGYDGLLPHNIAMQVQAVHERRLFEQRQNMMQDAVRGARGAASLLSSFRPGGGAAIESGIYSQIANLQMQRAQQTQPLDLLGDYRREQDSQARMQSNRASERAMAIQAVGAIASIATAGAGAGLAGAAITALGQGYSAYQNRKAAEAGGANRPSAVGAPPPGFDQGGGYDNSYDVPMPGPGETQLGIDPSTGGQAGGNYNVPLPPSGGSSVGAPSGGGYQSTLEPDGAAGGGQGQGAPGQRGAGGQEGYGDMGGGMGAGGGVGADGIFDTRAYAADAMRQPVMANPIVRLVAASTAVNMMDESGLIPALTYAADKALAQRLSA